MKTKRTRIRNKTRKKINPFDLNTSIVQGRCIGGIEIGDNYATLIKKFDLPQESGEVYISGNYMDYYYEVENEDILYFKFDLIESKIVYISCMKGYDGKFMHKIGIDSTKNELLQIVPDLTKHPSFDGVFYSPSISGIEFSIAHNIIYGMAVYNSKEVYWGIDAINRSLKKIKDDK